MQQKALSGTPQSVRAHRPDAFGGEGRVPGDKSISHRALILGGLALGCTHIRGLLEGADVYATADAMRALGCDVVRCDAGVWEVYGRGAGTLAEPTAPLDFGNSGTGCRLIMGAVAGSNVTARFIGDASLSTRPMQRVISPLEAMGAQITACDDHHLPLTLTGTAQTIPLDYALPQPSAQVKSAILLAALSSGGQTRVVETVPTRDHTERMLRMFGATLDCYIEAERHCVRLTGGQTLSACSVDVPGDPSSAAFLVVATLLVPGAELRLNNMLCNPHRDGLFGVLIEMGADIVFCNERGAGERSMQAGEKIVDVLVRHSKLKGVSVGAESAASMIDEYPILAIAAACAEGETHLAGLHELRVKESDRLAAIAAGLHTVGADVEMGEDWLTIRGREHIDGGVVTTHGDHRIAMSFLVLGLVSRTPIAVDDAQMIGTSFPNFFDMMEQLGASFERGQNVSAK